MTAITRDQIITALGAALEPLAHINAMWLGGSRAMGTQDEWSDIDVVLDVADGRHLDAFRAVEEALAALAPIAHRVALPEPIWHGHAQRLYRLQGCPEHLMVDLVIMQRSSDAPRFDEREIHGEPVIIFDKLGVVASRPVDRVAHRAAMTAHVARHREMFVMLRHLAGKELRRGRVLDALMRYHGLLLRLLLTALRARHAPLFYDFAPRYLERDLPPDVYERVMRLAFVASPADLEAKLAEILDWAGREYDALDVDAIEL